MSAKLKRLIKAARMDVRHAEERAARAKGREARQIKKQIAMMDFMISVGQAEYNRTKRRKK